MNQALSEKLGRLNIMKKIDAHTHIGDFGGWAKVKITADELIKQMNEY